MRPRREYGWIWGWALVATSLTLSSFGIYLGRSLGWNSWDFLVRPGALLADQPGVQPSRAARHGHPHHQRVAPVAGDGHRGGLTVHRDPADLLRPLGPGEVLRLVDHEPAATEHLALADVEHLDGGLEVVVGEADHVEVLGPLPHHLLPLDGLADGVIRVLKDVYSPNFSVTPEAWRPAALHRS